MTIASKIGALSSYKLPAYKPPVKPIPTGHLGGVASVWNPVKWNPGLAPKPAVAPKPAAAPAASPAAAPSSASATPPDTMSSTPLDPVYTQQVAGAQQTAANATAGYLNQANQALGQAGYLAERDPNDPFKVTSLTYDPSNPYSRASALRDAYRNQTRGNTTSMAARGQLYSGALQNAQNYAGDQFNKADNSLMQSVTSSLGNLGYQNAQAQNTALNAQSQAFSDSIARQQPSTADLIAQFLGLAASPDTTASAPAASAAAPASAGKKPAAKKTTANPSLNRRVTGTNRSILGKK